MNRLAPCFLLLCFALAAAPPANASKPPQFNTIVVNHFTNANGVNQSQEFINAFCDELRLKLEKASFKQGFTFWKVTRQALTEGAAVSDADAANSLVVEGKFTRLDKGSMFTKLYMEIDVYRVSDHLLVKTVPTHDIFPNHGAGSDEHIGKIMADQAVLDLFDPLQNVNLSSIRAAPPVPKSVPPAPAPAPLFASVQFSSSPAGADITIDGYDAGNTPSLIKLRPGTHSIRITKDGYEPWERTIDTGAGESRNLAPNLEKTGP